MRRLLDPAPATNLVWLDEVDSTNTLAARVMAAWQEGEVEPLHDTLLLAGRQTEGRGHGEHTWASPPGGLYATWVAWLPGSALPVLPMALGVSLAAAVEEMVPGVSVGLKWPNDLQVAGRKLGGVLCQSRGGGEAVWVMAGFGINVGVDPKLPVGDPVAPTSLASLGYRGEVQPAIWALVAGFLSRIKEALHDPAMIPAQWLARTVHRRGETMRVLVSGDVLEGRFAGLGRDGQLELEVGGQLRRVVGGELLPSGAKIGG